MIKEEFWKSKINTLKEAIEDKNIEYIYTTGIRDLALFYRTYFDDNILKNIVENLLALLEQTNNSLIHLSLIYLVSEMVFIEITEIEEFYKEKIKKLLAELTIKINKVKTTINKDYPEESKLYTSIIQSINMYFSGNLKTMESLLSQVQRSFPDNPKINLLLALCKTKNSSTIYKLNLIEVIKMSGNTLEKAIAQEMVGDISELLQSISWYDDSENIYSNLGLYRDLTRLYQKKIEKLKTDHTKKNQLAQEYIKLATTLLKLEEKEFSKKYFTEAFNILLQINSFIEILEIIEKNNLLELFPENKQELQEIIIKTFEKRITIDPYNINLYLEYSNWLTKLQLTEKQEIILKNAYKIAIEKRIYDKLILIAEKIMQIEPSNIEYISLYIESLTYNKQLSEEIYNFISKKLEELQKLGKINEFNILLQKYSKFIPEEKIKNMEREKLMSKLNQSITLEEKLQYLKEYINKYPNEYEIAHLYIVNKINQSKTNLSELYDLVINNIQWYKENLKNLKTNEMEIIFNILLENQDFENFKELIT